MPFISVLWIIEVNTMEKDGKNSDLGIGDVGPSICSQALWI